MTELVKNRFALYNYLPLLVAVCLCLYFTAYLVEGKRSLGTHEDLRQQISMSQQEYDDLKDVRGLAEARVVRLRPSSIDPDFLEERAQIVLGYVHPDEIVILNL